MPQTGRELIPAIVLAAGASTRFGRNKLLLPLGDQVVIDYPLQAIANAETGPVYVVLGHDAAAVRAHCLAAGYQLNYVENSSYLEGRTSSVQAGLARIASQACGVLVTPGDVPLITTPLIMALVAEFQRYQRITYPLTPAGRGHPVIFPRSAFSLLAALKGEATLHAHMTATGADVNAVAWDDTRCAFDIDTPEDLVRLQARL